MQIEHVAIWTRDLERLRSFYEKYFRATSGNKYVNHEKRFESYFLEFESGARLELMTRPRLSDSVHDPMDQPVGISHVAFAIGSDEQVDLLSNRLAQDGYRVIDGPRRTGDGYYESVVLDPDGNRIEITA